MSVIAGWFLFGLTGLISVTWIMTCIHEKEIRPAFISAVFSSVILTVFFIILRCHFIDQTWPLTTLESLMILTGCLLLLPFKPPEIMRYKPTPGQRVDERDALFHRFYRLKSGTPQYEQYYRKHPELQTLDDNIRRLPQLNEPGTPGYDPVLSPLSDAFFENVNKINHHLDQSQIAKHRNQVSPHQMSSQIKTLVKDFGAEAGIARLNPAWIYSHIGRGEGPWGSPVHLEHTHAVAIAVEMNYAMIRHAPEAPVIVESARTYFKTALIARILAQAIVRLGYSARAHVDGNYRVMTIPIAVDAGLGELGRHGLLITPKYGSRVRLSVVTTDLPLQTDKPIHFGVQDFCRNCKKCADYCPSRSISYSSKYWIRDVEKWPVRQDSCYHFWRNQGTDCAVCIRVCPYSHPDTVMHHFVRAIIKKNPISRNLAIMTDRFLYKHAYQ